MDKKKLEQLYYLNKEINLLNGCIKQLDCNKLPGMAVNISNSILKKLTNEIIGLKDLLTKELHMKQNEVRKINEYIDSITDDYIKEMIVLRYRNGMSWDIVGLNFNNTSNNVRMTCNRYLRKH